MSRYQKYSPDHLTSFRKPQPQKPHSSIRQPQPKYSSYSQEPQRYKPRTQQSRIDSYSHQYRDYSPQPNTRNRTKEYQTYPTNTAYNYNPPNKDKSNYLSPPSSKYDLTSSSVSAVTTLGYRGKKKSYSDVSEIENLSKSYARQGERERERNRGGEYDGSPPMKEEKEFLKQKYKSYINESRIGKSKKDEGEHLAKKDRKGEDISLIPHKTYDSYDGGSTYQSKFARDAEYRSGGDFKKDKSRFQDNSYLNNYKIQTKAYKQDYHQQYVSTSKPTTYKSQIKQNYNTKDYTPNTNTYSPSSYKADYKSSSHHDYISQIKDEIKKDHSPYSPYVDTTTSSISSYNLQSSSFKSSKLPSDKLTAYNTALSQKQQIKQAKKKYMEEMKIKLLEVNGLIQKSKQLHLQNQKTLNSFTYLTKPKIVYQKIKFIADIRDFQIGKQKGEGKFGTVHQAIHKATKTLYAIKKIPKQTIKTYMLQNQLALELQIQSFVDHPNILKIFGFFDDWQYVYIVLQYMEQGTLFEYLRKKNNNKLTQKDVANKIREITEAIKYLHDMDIAHRDIKPQNIVLSHGVAKLCDFGWATRCKDRRQTYCGTFDYAAPEILEGKEYNECVDLWCLGILTYELLFGKSPFYHLSKEETKRKVLRVDREQIEFPKEVEISWKARDFIESLLKKNPNDRRRVDSLVSHPFLTD